LENRHLENEEDSTWTSQGGRSASGWIYNSFCKQVQFKIENIQ